MKLMSIVVIVLIACSSITFAEDGKPNNLWRIKSDHGILMPDSSWIYYSNVSYINKTDTITADSALADKNLTHYTFKGNVVMKTSHSTEGDRSIFRTDKLEYTSAADNE